MKNDPIGQAILDFANQGNATAKITVEADLCDDDIIPVEYLFRTYDQMPAVEQKALDLCEGKILDVGAGSGCHSKYLDQKGFDVTALELSPKACEYLDSLGLNTLHADLWKVSNVQFDTILVLMNGVGLAGTISRLTSFLNHLKSLLHPDGKILIDSSDIRYLYQEEDGSYWIDLNAHYFGEMQFKMSYKDHETEWFQWVYVDPEIFEKHAQEAGLLFSIVKKDGDAFLVELKN